MEDIEVVVEPEESPEEVVAQEAPEEEAGAEAAEEGSEETAPAELKYDPTHYYRQRVEARRQRAEQARLAEIQQRMESLGKEKPGGEAPKAPAVPDREKDPEGWALHQMQEAARKALKEELAPLLASREQAQQEQLQQQGQQRYHQERMSEIAHLAEVQERHYPGYRERLKAWSEGQVQLAVQAGKPAQLAQQEVAQYIMAMADLNERQGKNPVHELDVLMSMTLKEWGWKPQSQRKADEDAAREVEETRKALSSPAAKTMTGTPRAPAGSHGKITGAALVKEARASGGKVERGRLVAAAKSRMSEANGNFSKAMDIVISEVAAAEKRKTA